jgi:hypothetical protein
MAWIFNLRLWLLIFVIFMLVYRPHTSAGLVHKGIGTVQHAGDGLATFVSDL